MHTRPTLLPGDLEAAVDAVLQSTLGAQDPRTLTPGDFRVLRARLRARGILHHPQLKAMLRARHIHAPAVLSPPARRPRSPRVVPCPPVRWRHPTR